MQQKQNGWREINKRYYGNVYYMVFLMFLFVWMGYVFWREVIYRLADIYSKEVGCYAVAGYVHYASSASLGPLPSGSISSSLAMQSNSMSFIPVMLVTTMCMGFHAEDEELQIGTIIEMSEK
jgi:hypothetical protein